MKSIKKAMLGVLCCVFISFVFAITISANGQNDDAPAPYIWIGNIKLENGKYIESAESSTTDIAPEDNYAHYENGVLTLKNYTYSGEGTYNADGYEYYDAINCSASLKLKLEGTNVITLANNSLGEFSYGIIAGGDIEIASDVNNASLAVSGVTGDALYSQGDISVENVTVFLFAKENGVLTQGNLTVRNGNLKINSTNVGVTCVNFIQDGGDVDVTAGKVGINASQYVDINSGKIVSKTTGTENNSNHVAIGNSVKQFNYDTDKLQVIVSDSSTGMPTVEYDTQNISSYRYVMVVAKELAPSPSYSVSFDVNGLEIDIPKQSVVLGAKVVKPEDPQVDSYQFVGWYKDVECNNVWNFDSDVVTGTITLYAKWLEKAPSHVHEIGNEWHSDNINHWNVCACSEKLNVSIHSFYSEGKCIVCGFKSPDIDQDSNTWKYIIVISVIVIAVSVGVATAVLIKVKKRDNIARESKVFESANNDTTIANTTDDINKENAEYDPNKDGAEITDSSTDSI